MLLLTSAAAVTLLIGLAIKYTLGLRVSEEIETNGIDEIHEVMA